MAAPRTRKSTFESHLEIVGAGCAAVDELFSVAQYPEPDSKVPIMDERKMCGGLVATALIAASRLGVRCGYAGILGGDEYSTFVLRTLEEENVDVSLVQHQPGTGPVRARIIIDRNGGSRTILFSDTSVVWPESSVLDSKHLDGLRVLFLDHFTLASLGRPFLEKVREKGIAIVADVENSHRPDILDIMQPANHLILSAPVARQITGTATAEDALRTLWTERRDVVVVTEGERGCLYMGKQDGRGTGVGSVTGPRHVPAFQVETVDTTGCGDVFHGAYAAALARELGVEERVIVASAAAACNATAQGAYGGSPSLAELRDFLSRNGYQSLM
jgi:ribokinase